LKTVIFGNGVVQGDEMSLCIDGPMSTRNVAQNVAQFVSQPMLCALMAQCRPKNRPICIPAHILSTLILYFFCIKEAQKLGHKYIFQKS
jgi:hypothetical protein